MSSTILHAIKLINEDKHRVGSLNDMDKGNIVNQGAKLSEEKLDNYSIVETFYDLTDEDEEYSFKALTDTSKKGYLVAAVEDYMEEYGENVGNFYLVKGERARLVRQTVGMRFEVSDYTLKESDLSLNPIHNGQNVYYDATTKKYVICNKAGDATPTEFTNAGNKYVLANKDGNIYDGQQTIRLEVAE